MITEERAESLRQVAIGYGVDVPTTIEWYLNSGLPFHEFLRIVSQWTDVYRFLVSDHATSSEFVAQFMNTPAL